MRDTCVHRSRALEQLAYRLYQLADDAAQPSRSSVRSEMLIHEAECIASQLRAEFRGVQ